jgi:hypothetical protein
MTLIFWFTVYSLQFTVRDPISILRVVIYRLSGCQEN